jgi:ribosomal protein S19
MGHLYNSNLIVKKQEKPSYLSPNMWRIMYLISSNPVHHTSEKRIRSRSSIIPVTFVGYEVIIHSGKKWHKRKVNNWMVGYKFGEFTWNRRYALYKAKQLRKKNSKKK